MTKDDDDHNDGNEHDTSCNAKLGGRKEGGNFQTKSDEARFVATWSCLQFIKICVIESGIALKEKLFDFTYTFLNWFIILYV